MDQGGEEANLGAAGPGESGGMGGGQRQARRGSPWVRSRRSWLRARRTRPGDGREDQEVLRRVRRHRRRLPRQRAHRH